MFVKRSSLPLVLICCVTLAGCGTTKWTDTRRTATEQLLISDAMDRAVSKLDFCSVAGKSVYLDSTALSGVTDAAYLVSLMRQHMLASGCIVKETREAADYVVEIRAGAVGTDRRDVMVGMPATQITGMLPVPGIPASIPDMPLAQRTEQRAVAKIAVFAYNRTTGRPVWQSGTIPVESKAKNIWVLGAGPFERGTIFQGTKFVGSKIKIPLITPGETGHKQGLVSVADEAYFTEPDKESAGEALLAKKANEPKAPESPAKAETKVAAKKPPAASAAVVPAAHTAPVKPPTSKPPPPAATKPPAPAPKVLPKPVAAATPSRGSKEPRRLVPSP